MNLAVVYGSSLFLSGWYFNVIYLYAFLIVLTSASSLISKISKGSKFFIVLIYEIYSYVLKIINIIQINVITLNIKVLSNHL